MPDPIVTERAVEVLRRGLSVARLDPSAFGVRVWTVGGETRTGFTDEPEPDDAVVERDGLRIFVAASIASEGRAIDVSAEHERIVVR